MAELQASSAGAPTREHNKDVPSQAASRRGPSARVGNNVAAAVAETPTWPDVNPAGKPRATYRNARIALLGCDLEFAFDRFADRALVRGVPLNGNDAFTDKTVSILRQCIIERFDFDPGKENVFDAAIELCHEKAFDPVQERVNALIWDGVSRLDEWLPTYAGTEDTPLNRAIGATVWIAAVRRINSPSANS